MKSIDYVLKNKSSKDTILIISILSDMKWHCWDCMIKKGVKRDTRSLRTLNEKGIIQLEKNGSIWGKTLFCEECNKSTMHRKLKSDEISDDKTIRNNITDRIKNIVKSYYDNKCVITNKKYSNLQIDHRVPVKRRKIDLDFNKMSNTEIIKYFMPISAHMNSLKKSKCEKCIRTGKRQSSADDVKFWYKGNENYDNSLNVQKACEGCFWFDPIKWREELYERIKR